MKTAEQTVIAEGRREIERVFARVMERHRAVRREEIRPQSLPIPTMAERLLRGTPRLKP